MFRVQPVSAVQIPAMISHLEYGGFPTSVTRLPTQP